MIISANIPAWIGMKNKAANGLFRLLFIKNKPHIFPRCPNAIDPSCVKSNTMPLNVDFNERRTKPALKWFT